MSASVDMQVAALADALEESCRDDRELVLWAAALMGITEAEYDAHVTGVQS